MGKKKGPAWNFFNVKKNKSVQCKYCNVEYKHANVNKMERHIKKCFQCPAGLKKLLNRNTTANEFNFKQTANMTTITANLELQEQLNIDVDDPNENCQASQMSLSSTSSNNTRSSRSPSLLKTIMPGTSSNFSSEISSSSLTNSKISKTHIDDPTTLLTAFVDHMDETSNVSTSVFMHLLKLLDKTKHFKHFMQSIPVIYIRFLLFLSIYWILV